MKKDEAVAILRGLAGRQDRNLAISERNQLREIADLLGSQKKTSIKESFIKEITAAGEDDGSQDKK